MMSLIISVRLNGIFKRLQQGTEGDKRKVVYIIRKTITQMIKDPSITKNDFDYIVSHLSTLMYKVQQNDKDSLEYLLSMQPVYYQNENDEYPDVVKDVTKKIFSYS